MTLRLFFLAILVLALPLPVQPWGVPSGDESSGMSAPVPMVAEPAQRLTLPRVSKNSFHLLPPLLSSFTVAVFAAYFISSFFLADTAQRRTFLVFGKLRLEGG